MKWPATNPGAKRHQVTILQQTTVSDVSGTTTVYAPFVTTYAAINILSGTDMIRAGQDTAKLMAVITITWQTGIKPNMRVQTASGSTFIVQAVRNVDELNIDLELTCIALGQNQ